MAATLNPSDRKNTLVDLSNGNLTAQGMDMASNQWVRSTAPRTGKVYFEFTSTLIANSVVGFSRLGAMTFPGFDNNSFGLFSNGTVALGNVFTSVGVTYGNSDIVCVAFDLNAKLVWFRTMSAGVWNGSSSNNPSTGIGGFSVAGYSGSTDNYAIVSGDAGYVTTVNFGASAFSGAVPTGYLPFNGAGFDFPASPTDGQVFYPPSGPIWIYSSAKGAWTRAKGTASTFNKVVNPTFQVSQENGSNTGTTSGFYAADQWQFIYIGTTTNRGVGRTASPSSRRSPYMIFQNSNNGP